MEIRLLGPLEVELDGAIVGVGGPRMRRLVSSIALTNGSVRSVDALVDAVWAGEDPPDGARRTLMSYVSRLRGVVGEGAIEQIEHGYRLVRSASTDVERFESLVIEGHHTLRAENHIQAAALFEEALRLWRGEPLAEFAGEHWAEPARARLINAHLDAIEGRFAARVALGDHAEVLGALEREADEHPERERLQFLHMLALYRSGRQSDALGRYESVRRHLAAMGLEPSPELRDLEYRILTHERINLPGVGEGSVVRGYRLEERLREASLGSIYRASQASVGREVAIKVVAPELANDPRFVRRFETEAQLVAHLEHPHIVPLYDYWRDPGGAFLVMRLLRGGSAEDRLRTDGPFPIAAVARVVDEIGGALAAAHARGVIHCDVKPANLLFDEDGRAYLADFGIAVHGVDRPPAVVAPPAGHDHRGRSGTDEVSVGGDHIGSDVYADIDAFGRTIGELLGLPSPCRSDDTAASGAAEGWPAFPAAVHAVLARASTVDPHDRFDTVADLILAFRAAVAGGQGLDVAHASGPDAPSDDQVPADIASASLVTGELATLNPYKGLRAFQEADAQDFYGRDRLVDELIVRVGRRRLVAVVGASGSGKSSLVRAGLVPVAAARGVFVTTVVPGAHPMEELENSLLRIATGPVPGLLRQMTSSAQGVVRAVRRILPPDDSELLLVVDQFEEVFTLAPEAEREAFVAGLIEAVTDDRSRTRVVVTIRADFFDRPLRHRRLGELLQDATLNVVPMSRQELTAAIEGPASRLGVRFEPGLVDSILADVGEGAGVLPLLQYALTELYQRRDGYAMTSRGYREIGGVTGALGQRAEEVFRRLDPADQDGARRLFMRLVTPGEGVEDTRRRALRSELTICTDAVIDAFGTHRLLSFDRDPATREPTVEVAHEALIREWPRLRSWLDDDRQGLRLLRHLTAAARAWADNARDPDELYRGSRLDAALEWATGREPELSMAETEFLDASRAQRNAELEEQQARLALRERQHRRLRRSLVGLGAVTVVALAATVVALDQRRAAGERADEAAAARSVAVTRRLVSDAVQLAPTDRRVALLLAAEAHRRQPDPASLGALKDVLAASTDVLGYVGADVAFTDVAWTHDGRIVGTHANGLVVIDGAGRRELEVPLTGAGPLAVRGDGRIAAVADSDETVRIVDLASGTVIGDPLNHGSPLQAVTFGRESALLATGDRTGAIRLFDERFAEILRIDAFTDVDPHALPEDVPPPLPHDPTSFREGVTDVAVSADGSLVAAVGGTEFAIWDAASGVELVRRTVTKVHGGSERAAVATAIGFLLVEGVERLAVIEVHSASIHDISGRPVDRWTVATGTTQVVAHQTADFTDDTVLSALDDGKLRIAGADGRLTVVDSHLGSVLAVSAEPDGRRAVVAGEDGALVVSLVGESLIARSVGGLDRQEVTVSADGGTLVNTGIGGIGTRLWRLSDGRFEETPMPGSTDVYAQTGLPFGLSFDERTLISRLHDPFTMEPYGPSFGPGGASGHGMSRDGRWLVLGGTRQINPDQLEVLVWDTVSGDLVARLDDFATDRAEVVRAVTFSPDDRKLLVAADDGRGVFYDTRTWEAIEPVLGGVVEAAYSHDGQLFATVSLDGAITFRDPVTLQPDGPPLLGNTDGVEGFSFGPFFTEDDRFMITAADGELRLFDVQRRVLVGGPFPRVGDRTGIAARNGRYGVTAIDDTAVIWAIEPDRWPEIACQAAGRNLTLDEWTQFGPGSEPYRATCEQWPSLAETERTDQMEVGR